MISCNEKKDTINSENKELKTSMIADQEQQNANSESLIVVPINEEPEKVASLKTLFSNRESYGNKSIIVSGEVVKINNAIMDRNWIHISDGSEFEGKRRLTITTQETVNIGDKVTFKGTLVLNKDFGYNYVYDIIVEQGNLLDHTPAEKTPEKKQL